MSNVNSNNYFYICRDHRVVRGLGSDDSEFTKSVLFFYFIRPYNIREERCCYNIAFIAGTTPTNSKIKNLGGA